MMINIEIYEDGAMMVLMNATTNIGHLDLVYSIQQQNNLPVSWPTVNDHVGTQVKFILA